MTELTFSFGEVDRPRTSAEEYTFESLVGALEGGDKTEFLDFVTSLLCWLPEDRLTTARAYLHPWLGVMTREESESLAQESPDG